MKVYSQSYRPVSVFGDEFVTGKPAAIGSEKKKKDGTKKPEREEAKIVFIKDEEDEMPPIIIEGEVQKPDFLIIIPRADKHLDKLRTGVDRHSEEPKK